MKLLDDGFRCSHKHCQWERNVEGIDYGFFQDVSGDCIRCKAKCRNDPRCGGVQCGINQKCSWWKSDACGNSEQQQTDVPGHFTCMKYDKGNKR